MIFLCDYYNQASKVLAYSLQAAGYDATTVVSIQMAFSLKELSLFHLLCGSSRGNWQTTLSLIPVPAFWEISGNNQMACI